MPSTEPSPFPDPIIIVGAGVFGLSTALALLHRTPRDPSLTFPLNNPQNPIHILDASLTLPNPHGSSVDSSRIIRPDYSNPVYSSLAFEAQKLWRDTSADGWGGEGRYNESGFVVTADHDAEGSGKCYVEDALKNVRELAERNHYDNTQTVEDLPNPDAIRNATGYSGACGDFGYVNHGSGWADAEACVRFALRRLKQEDTEGRVTISTGTRVERLTFSSPPSDNPNGKPRCTGVLLAPTSTNDESQNLPASLVLLSTGAWTPSLVSLRGRALATGQVLAYMPLSEAEQKCLEDKPVLMNMSRGMFVIPPRGRELKIARHGTGYRNWVKTKTAALSGSAWNRGRESEEDVGVAGRRLNGAEEEGEGETVPISVPATGIPIPPEGEQACREMVRELFADEQEWPSMAERPFSRTRICWYCDTPTSHFLITPHPFLTNLHLATGGSGHAFKFLPVIGDKIVDSMRGSLEPQLQELWGWREGGDGELVRQEDGGVGRDGVNGELGKKEREVGTGMADQAGEARVTVKVKDKDKDDADADADAASWGDFQVDDGSRGSGRRGVGRDAQIGNGYGRGRGRGMVLAEEMGRDVGMITTRD